MRKLLEEGQGRRLLMGAGVALVVISSLLVVKAMVAPSTYLLVLGVGTVLSVYLLHRGR